MTKIVYNNSFGGFSLPQKYIDLKGLKGYFDADTISIRTDPDLVKIVEDGDCGKYDTLAIAELPEGTVYRIDEYDGSERVMKFDDHEWHIA